MFPFLEQTKNSFNSPPYSELIWFNLHFILKKTPCHYILKEVYPHKKKKCTKR